MKIMHEKSYNTKWNNPLSIDYFEIEDDIEDWSIAFFVLNEFCALRDVRRNHRKLIKKFNNEL